MAERGGFFARLRRPVSATETVGVTGAVVTSGYLQSQEKNPALRDDRRYQTYSDILTNVSIVGAGARFFLSLIAKSGWKVEPPDADLVAARRGQRRTRSPEMGDEPPRVQPDDEAVMLAEIVEEMMTQMQTPWARVIRRAAMYRFYGFSVQEWTATRRPDGLLSMLDVAPRPQQTITRWDCDETGVVLGVIQESPSTHQEIYLPRAKIIYLVDDALSDSPEGLGIFRHLAEPALRLLQFQRLEAYGFETDLRGVPIGRAPLSVLQDAVKNGKLSEAEARQILEPLETFMQKHIKNPELGIMLDSVTYQAQDEAARPTSVPQWALEQLEADNAESAAAIMQAIERVNRELARIMGVEHLLLGGDGRGSLALSRDKTLALAMIVDSVLSEIREAYENDYLARLWQLNGWDPALMPSFRTDPVQIRAVEEITTALQQLAQAGAPLADADPAVDHIRGLLGLPQTPLSLVSESQDDAALTGGEPADEE